MSQFDLELKRLQKIYPGGTLAVEGFDLAVEKGEFISFVGPSGCGKTTTLRMIAGLESITSGELLIRGRNFTSVPAEKRPTATIFQNYAIFPHMTVYQNLCFGLEVRGLPATEIKKKVDAIIDTLELGDVTGAREAALSGGQKQRVALARGLVTQPEILLLDEPLGALDANLRKSIQEELKILQRDLGITFVFVTHAQSEALAMGDRVVVMNNGRVEQISDPFELYTRPRSGFVARFIGRNKIIDGQLTAISSDRASVRTAVGLLSGVPGFDATSAREGDAAMLVTPSEYVDLRQPGGTAPQDGENRITGTVSRINQIGHVVHVDLQLADDLDIKIETHREQIVGRGVEPGAQMDLCWRADRATVVLDKA
jgi:putative spermidine/putrescine transport system ATP-binding protein/spermidine/putrescine transport system ATP-binding protein